MYAVDHFIDRLEADVRRAAIFTPDDMSNQNAMIYDADSDTMVPFRTMLEQPQAEQSDYEFGEPEKMNPAWIYRRKS